MTDENSSRGDNLPLEMVNLNCGDSIASLDISRSQLTSVPSEIVSIKNLISLNLSHNKLSSVALGQSLSTLQILSLDFNELHCDESTFDNICSAFPSVKSLSIAFNKPKVGEENEVHGLKFSAFSELIWVNLSGNALRGLKRVEGNEKLETLIIHSNSMERVPVFTSCESVKTLDLSNNRIGSSCEEFGLLVNELPSLRCLDVSGNFDLKKQITCLKVPQKSVNFVEVDPLSELCTIAFSNSLNDAKTSLCISTEIFAPKADEKHILVGLIHGTSFAEKLRHQLADIIRSEVLCTETSSSYLKNALLACFKYISAESGQNEDETNQLNIIVCHLKVTPSNGIDASIACCGDKVTLRLISGHPYERTETPTQTQTRCKAFGEISVVNLLSQNRPAKQGEIPDPITHELKEMENTSLLLMGISLKDDFEGDVCTIFGDSCLSLSDKLKQYTETIRSLNEGHLVVALQPKFCPNAEDFPEKYKSWESILAHNHKMLFRKELQTIEAQPPVVSGCFVNFPLKAFNAPQNFKGTAQLRNAILPTFKI